MQDLLGELVSALESEIPGQQTAARLSAAGDVDLLRLVSPLVLPTDLGDYLTAFSTSSNGLESSVGMVFYGTQRAVRETRWARQDSAGRGFEWRLNLVPVASANRIVWFGEIAGKRDQVQMWQQSIEDGCAQRLELDVRGFVQINWDHLSGKASDTELGATLLPETSEMISLPRMSNENSVGRAWPEHWIVGPSR